MRTHAASLASRAMSFPHRVESVSTDKILIVEQDKETCQVLCNYLEDRGFEVAMAGSCARAEQLWRTARPDLAICDYSLPDGNVRTLIPRLKRLSPSIPIIILTGYGSIDLAVEALKLGAEHFLPKPPELATLDALVQRCLENQRCHRREFAEKARNRHLLPDPFLGNSDFMQRLYEAANKATATDAPVLIYGEPGTGKSTLARWLHRHGPRACQPFVGLRCGGVPSDRLEKELFGDDGDPLAGTPRKAGILEIAHRGTVFLAEIQGLDRQTHSLLRKVVEEKQFCRLGEIYGQTVDIRLIASTPQLLPSTLSHKRFRGEISDRIPWTRLSIPPLRDRLTDIPTLCARLLEELTAELGTGELEIGRAALQALQRYSWPGNLRELKCVLELAALSDANTNSTDQPRCLDHEIEQYLAPAAQFRTLEEMERNYIKQVLRREQGRVRAAAQTLGIPRSSLYHKLKQYRSDPTSLWPIS